VRYQNVRVEITGLRFKMLRFHSLNPDSTWKLTIGPLGGAKLAASGLAKGSKALKASLVRLGEIPIFLPAGVGTGAMFKIKTVIQPVSAWAHRKKLRNAVEALYGFERGTGETTHHIVALNDPRAKEARKILDKFGIDIDDGVNGVLDAPPITTFSHLIADYFRFVIVALTNLHIPLVCAFKPIS
jgi:hypothetical protein